VMTEMEVRADDLACSALRETDSEVATLLFQAAREIYELSLESTNRIESLDAAIAKLESDLPQPDGITTSQSAGSPLLASWGEGAEPRLVGCLRLAGTIMGPDARAEVDRLILSILELETRYAALYKNAQALRTSTTSVSNNENCEDILSGRTGCYCCREGCHICENCQPHLPREMLLRRLSQTIRGRLNG
jgi:hypothetical protein